MRKLDKIVLGAGFLGAMVVSGLYFTGNQNNEKLDYITCFLSGGILGFSVRTLIDEREKDKNPTY